MSYSAFRCRGRVLATLTAVCLSSYLAAAARADFIEVRVPGIGLVVVLEGEVTQHAGNTATYRHPRMGSLTFNGSDILKVHKARPFLTLYQAELGKARASKSPEAVFNVAELALRRGSLNEFYKAVEIVLELDPRNEEAARILKLKAEIDKPVSGSSPEEEAKLRKTVKKSDMKIALSDHFILLHDTPDRPAPNSKSRLPRAEQRLQLLERVYKSFLLKFHAKGVELDIPDRRMMVVLFNDYQNYRAYATSLSPSLSSASGFFDPKSNISVFFDHGTRDTRTKKIFERLEDMRKDAQRAKIPEVVRLINSLEFLAALEQENSDIMVVSHECTHQMAANTGLLPRDVMVPSWVHEGLATYFEAPGDCSWAGFGAVSEERLDFYRVLEKDRVHSNIDFIVGDKIFDYARSLSGVLHGYAQAWALTHFLMDRHFDKFMIFYRRLGEFPPDTMLSADVLVELFSEVFGEDRKELDQEWRLYMNQIKTDLEKATRN